MKRLMGVAVLLILAGATVAVFLDRSAGPSLDQASWFFQGGEREGWSVRYPSTWSVTALTEAEGRTCSFLGYENGVIVSSVEYPFLDPHGGRDCYGRFVLADFPRTGVALALQPYGFRRGIFRPQEDTIFPLSYGDLTHSDAIRGGPVHVSWADIVINKNPVYQVRLWIGRDASQQDRAAILAVLGSIHFLRGPLPP